MKTFNAIFIQPTFNCALNCKGCYVKESTKHEQIDRDTLLSLIRYLWVSDKFWIKQITLAVDDLPDEEEARDKMIGALSTVLRLNKLFKNKIELHITCNSLSTIQKYVDAGLSLEYITQNLDLLSVSRLTSSDIPTLRYIRQFTRVNYNYMPTPGLRGYEEILSEVDQSYYILHKAGLGRSNNPEYIRTFKEGLRELSGSRNRHKIITDSCVTDSIRFLREGTGCSAGISKIHIWPDGHVTGCPYNKEGGTPAYSVSGICDNILAVHGRYEFRSCRIPKDINNQSGLRIITG